MNKVDFDTFYGKGMMHLVRGIINELAPNTRRDEWWASDGPYNIIATHLMSPKPPAQQDGAIRDAAKEVVAAVETTHDHTQWFTPLAKLIKAVRLEQGVRG